MVAQQLIEGLAPAGVTAITRSCCRRSERGAGAGAGQSPAASPVSSSAVRASVRRCRRREVWNDTLGSSAFQRCYSSMDAPSVRISGGANRSYGFRAPRSPHVAQQALAATSKRGAVGGVTNTFEHWCCEGGGTNDSSATCRPLCRQPNAHVTANVTGVGNIQGKPPRTWASWHRELRRTLLYGFPRRLHRRGSA